MLQISQIKVSVNMSKQDKIGTCFVTYPVLCSLD